MAGFFSSQSSASRHNSDFFEYWGGLGFFENLQMMLPPEFFVLFEIARNIFTDETSDICNAIEDISKEEKVYEPDRNETIQVNRIERIVPLSDHMEIDTYRTINEMKKALPRELANDDQIFDIKLFTKTLLVQKFYESEADSFKPISTSKNDAGKDANRFEQNFYILLDRSRSMDNKMRSFYSKCVVAEFLRRKINSKAKIFFRPFDSKAGKLVRVERPEEFPKLVEHVLMTTTGGTSTNIQAAVYQAINDIKFDKDMLNTEILVVTDGLSKIDRGEMKDKLGSIKLNVLKIGKDVAEVDYYDMKTRLDQERIDFDPSSLSLKGVQEELSRYKDMGEESGVSLAQQRAFRMILDYSDGIFKNLYEVSNKFIEVADMPEEGIFEVTDEMMERINDAVKTFEALDLDDHELPDKKYYYKQIFLFLQYLEVLLDRGNGENKDLQDAMKRTGAVKQKMMADPELLFVIMKTKELQDDKKAIKLAKKQAKELMKDLQMDNKNLTMKEMKRAQILFNMDVGGEGKTGQFLLLIIIKLFQFIGKILAKPFGFLRKKDKDEETNLS